MYMSKVRKTDGVNLNSLEALDGYYSWLERSEDYKDCSLKDWCGVNLDDVPLNLIDDYKKDYIDRYSTWDIEHRYGHNSIFESVAYWRKANQIHCWFVDNVQDGIDDCGIYEVSKEQIEDLLDICKEILDKCLLVPGKVHNGDRMENGVWKPIIESGETVINPEIALELLPPTGGFFFGSTDIDQWYMQDIEYTVDVFTKILEDTNFEKEILCYHSSW